jgi:vacuolar protein-sorting-associated protein 4
MSEQTRLQQARDLEQKGIEKQNEGKYAEAKQEYMGSLKVYEFVYKFEQNPKVKEMVGERMKELMDRVEKLNQHLNAPQTNGGGYSGGATAQRPPSGSPQSPGGTEGDKSSEQDEEKEKLKKALGGQILTEKPNIKWGDVAGLTTAKEMLQETIIMPIKFPQMFTGKRKPWRGILLYGPPGTGKSFLAKACATEMDGTFFAISSSDLVSKWQGESEKNVRTLFEMARDMTPSIVFVDEVDSLCGARGDGESEAARRIKTEFLAQMDGVGKTQGGQMLVLGATNTPWDLDSAIRRRFEKRIYIALPDLEARIRMLELNLGDTPHEVTQEDLAAVAARCENFSGADLSILTRDALMEPLRRTRKAKTFKQIYVTVNGEQKLMWSPCSPADPAAREMDLMQIPGDQLATPKVLASDFQGALEHCKTSVSPEQLKDHDKWTQEFGMEGSGEGHSAVPDNLGDCLVALGRLTESFTLLQMEPAMQAQLQGMPLPCPPQQYLQQLKACLDNIKH